MSSLESGRSSWPGSGPPKSNLQKGTKIKAVEIWQRFPKFVLGYMATFAIVLAVGLLAPTLVPKAKAAMNQANVFRGIFFVMTFFTIGVVSDFRRLWQEGIGKLALVYILVPVRFHSSGSGWRFPGCFSMASRRQSREDKV